MISLYVDGVLSNEMFLKNKALLYSSNGWMSNTNPYLQKPCSYKGTSYYVAPKLANLPASSNNFAENSDPENKFN